jgi:hypothetical protein
VFPSWFISGIEIRKEMGVDQIAMAQFIAESVHATQVDKVGAHYITHPIRVVENLKTIPDFDAFEPDWQEACIVAAWLHDVVEDSGANGFPQVTIEHLHQWGIGLATTLISLLTRPSDKSTEAQDSYYEEIGGHRAARYVKWADIADNLNRIRLDLLPSELRERSERKYAHALEILHMDERQKEWLAGRIAIDPTIPTQSCPICHRWVTPSTRYPNYVCNSCQQRMVDVNQKAISFSNTSFIGTGVTPAARAFIDGVEVYAAEAHFGGVVIRPKQIPIE